MGTRLQTNIMTTRLCISRMCNTMTTPSNQICLLNRISCHNSHQAHGNDRIHYNRTSKLADLRNLPHHLADHMVMLVYCTRSPRLLFLYFTPTKVALMRTLNQFLTLTSNIARYDRDEAMCHLAGKIRMMFKELRLLTRDSRAAKTKMQLYHRRHPCIVSARLRCRNSPRKHRHPNELQLTIQERRQAAGNSICKMHHRCKVWSPT